MRDGWLSLLVEKSAQRLGQPPARGGAAEPRRGFREALSAPGVRVIAEVKRRSPSAGVLREPLRPAELAAAYARAGAAAVSVVTEPEFFAGDTGWIAEVRRATELPVLQKDFFSRPEHLAHGAASGADAVLLIARILPGGLLGEMLACCRELGLEALVETHDPSEVERALAAGAKIVGVNSRDLDTFAVDVERAAALVRTLPPGVIGVLESGVKGKEQFADLLASGVRRFLVGEYLLRQQDPERALGELVTGPWSR